VIFYILKKAKKNIGDKNSMPYCPKCGNQVDENMTFCPRCGAPQKSGAAQAAQPQAPPTGPVPTYRRRDEKSEKNEKNEKNEQREKNEKQEKGEHGFIGWLIGGLVLIIIGIFSLLQASGYLRGANWAFVLVLIGIVIIIAAVYLASVAKKRSPQT
jgi:cation transport ATPase